MKMGRPLEAALAAPAEISTSSTSLKFKPRKPLIIIYRYSLARCAPTPGELGFCRCGNMLLERRKTAPPVSNKLWPQSHIATIPAPPAHQSVQANYYSSKPLVSDR